MPASEPIVVLFDGTCLLCSGMVRFIVARDPAARVRFAALQSETAQRLLVPYRAAVSTTNTPDTLVVLCDGLAHTQSDAVFAVATAMPAPWRMLRIFRLVPRTLRDALYRIVARNRHRWFGRSGSCLVPTDGLRARFLE